MVQLDVIRAANTALFQGRPFVAVFAGATSGIGEATLRAFATANGVHGKGLRAYVVGRRKEPTEEILTDCSRLCPDGNFIFVHAKDLALLEEVDKVCSEITRAERETAGKESARIDLLFMSQGDFNFSPRRDTKEGLEFRVSLLYYSRMRFISNLLPLLLTSDLPAHVISVFAAGMEGEFHLNDMSIRDPRHWGMLTVRSHVCVMHTFFFERLAEQHRGKISLVHLFPGMVMTKAFQNPGVPLWGRLMFRIFRPILSVFATPVSESGERTLFLASPQRFPACRGSGDQPTKAASAGAPNLVVATGTDGKIGSGAYAVDIDGETCHKAKMIEKYRAGGVGEKIWEHTMKVFDVIASGNIWTE
ncbi:hypothetical protein G647_05828 [Cladophialophora carrionii CBS 160.54]|uniref:Ketoreductase (KR) domain-containing protein n=1 Tax=Cladophialophora carrionii CBS 160.54 TaxID=1279043 RepID=V9D4C7_9EURO|nr:uncharacterized protein G647_05828 [Cladophialophora carrionii CBS 160.54]ETI21759.1 hypothetical protein G647_05828 [Cladophialophora carrionii CBS 160.54]